MTSRSSVRDVRISKRGGCHLLLSFFVQSLPTFDAENLFDQKLFLAYYGKIPPSDTDLMTYQWRTHALKKLKEWVKKDKEFDVQRDDRMMKFLARGMGARITRG